MRQRLQDPLWTTEFVPPVSLASTNPLPPLLHAFLAQKVTTPTIPPHLFVPHVHQASMRLPLQKPTVTLALLVNSTVKLPRPLPLPAKHVPQVCIKMHLEVPNASFVHQVPLWLRKVHQRSTMNCRIVKLAEFFNLIHSKVISRNVICV